MSDSAVEEAKKPGVFSLEKFLADISYPVEEVVVHTNAYAVNELIKLRARRQEVEDGLAKQEQAKRAKKSERTVAGNEEFEEPGVNIKNLELIQYAIEQLDKTVADSALYFSLRGMPPHIVDAITKKHFTDPKKDYSNLPEESARDFELVAKTIISVKDSGGNFATEEVTPEYVEKLKGGLLEGEYAKIIRQVAHVNLNGVLFDQATDASFLSGRSYMAGE
jgi:hypothetical protein